MKKAKGRNAAGTGSIRKKTVVRNGKTYSYWEGRYTDGFDPGTGKQCQKSVTGKTQKEVALKLRKITAEIDNGTYQAPNKITVGEWFDVWATDYLNNVKPLTVEKYTCVIKNHIKPKLAAVRLEAVTTTVLQHFYNELGRAHGDKPALSAKTIKYIHGVIHKALQQAVEIGYIRTNPSSSCKLPKVVKPDIKPMDSELITVFLQEIKGHRFEVLYIVALFMGIRRGEICGLKWDCVDFERGTVCIRRQLQKIPGVKGGFRLVSTKSDKERTITPAPTIMNLLKHHLTVQNEMRLNAGSSWQDNDYVFCNENGEHLSPSTVYHNYKRIVEKLGIPERRLHDLRHSYAVASLMSGDDIKTVQENMGHFSAAFTLDRYGHVTEEMKTASAQRMEKFIQSISDE